MHQADEIEDDNVLRELAAWLCSRGFGEAEVQLQMRRLMTRKGPKWRVADGFGPKSRSPIRDGSPVAGLSSPPPTPTDPVPDQPEKLDLEMMEDEGGMAVSRGTYVLSVVGRSKRRTLHQVGACYRCVADTGFALAWEWSQPLCCHH